MIPYNTDMQPVRLQEFGRNLQNLVDYCVEIPDREERTACAHAIVKAMVTLHPDVVIDKKEYSKAWDILNIMSGFRLDVDFPCEVISEERMSPKPERIPYGSRHIKFRHYGKNIEKMIDVVSDMEEGEERDLLISLIAHHMKKLMLQHNKEGVDDAKVLRDLCLYSGGRIDLDPETYLLHEIREAAPVKQQGGKKRRKK